MNTHLNVFKTYAKTERQYQLENDLTRSLAICLQEDSLFFHQFLTEIIGKTTFYNQLFESPNSDIQLLIDIQKSTSKLETDIEHIFAISLSESEISDFWSQTHNQEYDPICDIIIVINDILFIIEAKRDNVNCTSQLYNQVLNFVKNVTDENVDSLELEKHKDLVTPVDLNWRKLMTIAIQVLNFENATKSVNRFLSDFVELVRNHNYSWLPEPSISALKPDENHNISRRIKSVIEELSKNLDIVKLNYDDRLGLEFPHSWANELLFSINNVGDLVVSLYPGNTKGQGYDLFKNTPEFSSELDICGGKYPIIYYYHIKFTSFQKYFTGLNFDESKLKRDKFLYTVDNFHRYTGRKKRDSWNEIEKLFDNYLDFDWKNECKWNDLIINSGKSQFDISFGYAIELVFPFNTLRELDKNQNDLSNLVQLFREIHTSFRDKLLIQS